MAQIQLDDTTHIMYKVNLVSNRDGSDDYKCSACGLEGKRLLFSPSLKISNRTSEDKIKYCPGMVLNYSVGDEIIVVNCIAQGAQFANLTRASFHEIVEAPKPYKNDTLGVWVMGVGEPVKLLNNEFNFV